MNPIWHAGALRGVRVMITSRCGLRVGGAVALLFVLMGCCRTTSRQPTPDQFKRGDIFTARCPDCAYETVGTLDYIRPLLRAHICAPSNVGQAESDAPARDPQGEAS